MDLNRVIIAGRLDGQVDLKTTGGGQSYAKLNVETVRRYKDKKNEIQEVKTIIEVTVWGYQADNCSQFLNHGSNVLIEGRLQVRSWQDNQQRTQTVLEVVAENVQFGASRRPEIEDVVPQNTQRPVPPPPTNRPAPSAPAAPQAPQPSSAPVKPPVEEDPF